MNWNAVATAGSGLAGGLLSLGGARLSYKYNNRLMANQFNFQKQAFEMENDRQDYLLRNSQAIAKQALRNAGYSTADPNGTGVSAPAVSSMGSPSPGSYNSDLASSVVNGLRVGNEIGLLSSQIRLQNAQAHKLETETDYQQMYNELYSVYGEDQMKSALRNMQEDTKLKVATSLKTDQDRLNSIRLNDAQVKDINERLQMDWQKLNPTLRLLSAQAFEAEESGDLKKAQISEVWQNIRESMQRIDLMKKQGNLNDAQVAVAYEQVKNVLQDTRNKKVQGGILTTESAKERLAYDVQNSLGVKYHMAKEILDAVIPLGTVTAALGKVFGVSKSK